MVSIALASYNGEKYIREQLDSILEQTYKNFELIICDDCSTDSTRDILIEYEQQDNRIHIFFNTANIGFKKNFEKAISLCKGEYIALSDQDDIWTNNHLEVLLEYKGSFQLVCSNSEHITYNGIKTGHISQYDANKAFKDTDTSLFVLLFSNFVQGCTILIDRTILHQAFPIPDEVEWHDYWLAVIAAMNHSIIFINKITVLYRQHNNNVTRYGKSLNNKRYYHTLYIFQRLKMIEQMVIRFDSKLTTNQKNICNLVYTYSFLTVNKKKYINRIIFFIRYYKIIYLDKSLLLFLPRIIFKLLLIPYIPKQET
jgi:glycosyltransferase involved in cell wall biosynthesis